MSERRDATAATAASLRASAVRPPSYSGSKPMVEPECVAEERRALGEVPLQSPISAPRPGFGPATIEPGPWTRREILGYVVWGSIGIAVALFECLAAFGTATPWPTLSGTVGRLERPLLGGDHRALGDRRARGAHRLLPVAEPAGGEVGP